MFKRRRLGSTGLIILLLSACGGGGGGGGGPAPANLQSAPVASALNSYYQANHGFDLSASSGGNNYTLQYGFALNSGTTMFNGVNANSVNVSVTVSENGAVVGTEIETGYFTLNPLALLGIVNSTGSPYAIVTTWNTPPATLSVGQSGPFYSYTIYHDGTEAYVDGTATVTYSVNAVNSTTLQYCTNASVSANANSDGVVSGTSALCYYINGSGNVTGITETISVGGTTLTFQ